MSVVDLLSSKEPVLEAQALGTGAEEACLHSMQVCCICVCISSIPVGGSKESSVCYGSCYHPAIINFPSDI